MGTHEFVDLCRRTGAEPFYCVNFMSDGRPAYSNTWDGQNRCGDAREAADWVSYANDPDNQERRDHGVAQPYGLKLWQLGNETSYSKTGFTKEEAIATTIEVRQGHAAARPLDPTDGLGRRRTRPEGADCGPPRWRSAPGIDSTTSPSTWASRDRRARTRCCAATSTANPPEKGWQELMEIRPQIEARLKEIGDRRSRGNAQAQDRHHRRSSGPVPLLAAPERWLVGVYQARSLNTYQRHGDMVKIATNADFEGTRWAQQRRHDLRRRSATCGRWLR